jgi:hypothetical protein
MFCDREAALRREMQATMHRVNETAGKEPGMGNIRGIGAERRVDGKVCEGGTMDREFSSFLFPPPFSCGWAGHEKHQKRNAAKQTARITGDSWGKKSKKFT